MTTPSLSPEALEKAAGSAGASFLRRHLICRFRLCGTFRQRESDTHLWGECTICGKKVGVISREAVRRFIEAEEYHREFLAKRAGGSGRTLADANPKAPSHE